MALINPDEYPAILARAYPDDVDDGIIEATWNGKRVHGWAAAAVGAGLVLLLTALLPLLVIGHIVLRLTGRRGFAYKNVESSCGHSYGTSLSAQAFGRVP